MIQWVETLLERRKNRRRDAEFRRGIASFNRKVLEPKGLHFGPEAQLIHQKKNRRVFADAKRVWKFYHGSQRDFARNFAAAAERLEEADISAPRILYQAFSKKTEEKYGLSLILMERIEGNPVGREEFTGDPMQRKLGGMLAALHSIKSPVWGDIRTRRRLKRQGKFSAYCFGELMQENLRGLQSWLKAEGQPRLEGVEAYFTPERLAATDPPDERYSFVSLDAHHENFFVLADGSLAMIDLDLAAYWDFPCDLSFVITDGRNFTPPAESGTLKEVIAGMERRKQVLLDTYFERLPENRKRWEATREAHVIREIIRTTSTMIKGIRPEYNDYFGRDPKLISEVAHRSVMLLRNWLRDGS